MKFELLRPRPARAVSSAGISTFDFCALHLLQVAAQVFLVVLVGLLDVVAGDGDAAAPVLELVGDGVELLVDEVDLLVDLGLLGLGLLARGARLGVEPLDTRALFLTSSSDLKPRFSQSRQVAVVALDEGLLVALPRALP